MKIYIGYHVVSLKMYKLSLFIRSTYHEYSDSLHNKDIDSLSEASDVDLDTHYDINGITVMKEHFSGRRLCYLNNYLTFGQSDRDGYMELKYLLYESKRDYVNITVYLDEDTYEIHKHIYVTMGINYQQTDDHNLSVRCIDYESDLYVRRRLMDQIPFWVCKYNL